MSVDELKNVFLGNTSSLSDGSKVEPVLAESGAAHDEFLKDVVGKSAPALKNHLKTLVFTGKGSMPKSFASEADIVKYVAKTPGAIGYVSAGGGRGRREEDCAEVGARTSGTSRSRRAKLDRRGRDVVKSFEMDLAPRRAREERRGTSQSGETVMKRMGLTGRIWLSLGVFVIGYLCSVTVAQIQGVQAENRLERTSEALFPVAQKVQEAEAGFERMTRAFGDSVMLEDTAALDRAEQSGTEAAKLLSGAAKTPKLGAERAKKLGELASQLHALATEGKTTYASMIGAGDLTAEMQSNMRALAERTEGLKGALATMRQQVVHRSAR